MESERKIKTSFQTLIGIPEPGRHTAGQFDRIHGSTGDSFLRSRPLAKQRRAISPDAGQAGTRQIETLD
jgi:hypothetical protein